jgi:glyoxylase-like metal-dependent hydrolase (beta-lactamase superfamily II)
MRIVQHISHTPFKENSYILSKNDQIIIIDPGDKPEYYDNYFQNGEKLLAVLATHGHLDHIFSASELCKTHDCPFIMSSKDQGVLDLHRQACEKYLQSYYGTPLINVDIAEKNELILGDFKITIIHTPGHTKGGVCYLIDNVLFSGDTLFYRSIGHVNQYDGNPDILLNSIKHNLYILPDDTIVYPGHMGATTIGEEKQFNPFVTMD